MTDILTAETAYADPDLFAHPGFRDERVPISRRAATINARALGVILRPSPGAVADMSIVARVDHGRMVADCPFCRSAQMASETDSYFLCADCFNRPVGGRLIPVIWSNEV